MSDMRTKEVDVEIKDILPDTRTIKFLGSDETVDRHGDIVRANGWELQNYLKNPVFLWGHQHRTPPVGKSLATEINGTRLQFDIQFAPKDVHPLADTVYQLYRGGFLKSTSVGFIGKEFKLRNTPREIGFIQEFELNESIIASQCYWINQSKTK